MKVKTELLAGLAIFILTCSIFWRPDGIKKPQTKGRKKNAWHLSAAPLQ